MLAKSHMLSTMVVTVPFLSYIEQEQQMYLIISILIGSVFPDLDEKGSYLSRRVYFVSMILSSFTTHRGATHTFFAIGLYLIIGLYFATGSELMNLLVIGFIIGNIVHLLGDMSTVEGGLRLFYPFSNKNFYILPKNLRIKTNGFVEKIVIIPLMGIILSAEIYFFIEDIIFLANN